MPRTMYDSTTPTDIPITAEVVAGYIDGLYKWPAAGWRRFPTIAQVRIAVHAATNDGDVLDCEKGDATPTQCPGWIKMRQAAGYLRPTIYCPLSDRDAVVAACQGLSYDLWIAHYTYTPHNEAGAVATQYADPPRSGGHYDLSVVVDDGWPHRTGDDMTPEQEQLLKDCQSILSQLKGAAGDPVQTIREIAQEVVSANFRWWAGPVDGNGGQLLLDIKAKVDAGGGGAPVPRSGTWTTS